MKNDLKAGRTSGSHQAQENGPWDNSALAKLREWDPIWAGQCLKMSDDPWTGGILPRKDVEVITLR